MKDKTKLRIGVVGGGAAGMLAAITAAAKGAEVTLLEGGERVGKKLLSTGNGKCNLSNLVLSARDYCGAEESWITACLKQFGVEETIRFFESIGLMIKNKNGYLYPLSEQAGSVVDVLRIELARTNVTVVTQCRVHSVEKGANDTFQVSTPERVFIFDRVILACGSKAAPKTGSDGSGYKFARRLGHKVVPTVPALVQLCCEESYLKEVAGVRTDACIRIINEEDEIRERGELQLTNYGISGIPVFQLSRKVNYLLDGKGKNGRVEVSIDLLPDYSKEEVLNLWETRKLLVGDRTVEEFFTGMLNKKLMLLFIKLAGLKRDLLLKNADEEKLLAVFGLCKEWNLTVSGSNSYENAQVCAGGVDTSEVGENMESLLVKGLFFAGEILDVDGRCGGYNLQWAWCSGYIAGKCAAIL